MSVLRSLRRLGEALTVLTLLLIAAGAGLWWWTGTQHSLDWAWARYAQPLGLQGERVTGSLREGVRAQRLQWAQDGLEVQARAADIRWNPVELLLQRRLHLTHLRAAELTVQDRRPATAPQAPDSLALPVAVAIDDLMVGRLRWQGGADVEVADLSAHYRYARGEHQLGLRNAAMARGRYQGELRLGDAAPLPLRASLTGEVEAAVPGRAQALKLAVEARAEGPLADLGLQGRLGPVDPVPDGQAPRADLTARLTPWQQPVVPQAQAQLQHIDLSVLWPQAPQTVLRGALAWQPAAQGWSLAVDLANARPGPWDRGLLPLSRLQGRGEWRDGTALARDFTADLGGGRAEGRGEWLGNGGWRLQARLRGVSPGALHTALGTAPLSGRVDLDGRGGVIGFDADVQAPAQARHGASLAADPAAASPAAPRASATPPAHAIALERLKARGRWDGRRLALPELNARAAGATLEGSIEAEPALRTGQGRLSLTAHGLRARAQGQLAEARGQGTAVLEVASLSQAQAWLQRLPGLPPAAGRALAGVEGEGRVALDWRGGWRAPTVQARLTGRATQGQGPDARRLAIDLAGQASASGPLSASTPWQGRLDSLLLTLREPALAPGDWTLRLQQPLALRIAGARVETGAGQAVLTAPVRSGPSQASLAWDPIRWGRGELQTAGRLTGLPMAWLALVGHVPPTGDLVFDGQWEARLGASLRLRASLARARGDITLLAETAEGTPARVTAGVREARLAVDSDGDAVNLALRWDSERAGTLDGRLSTRLARGGSAGWRWPEDAPLAGRLQARLPRMAVWSLLAPPGWRLRGSLEAEITVAGTRADPRLQGPLRADDLGLRSVVDGVALQDGRLRARLDTRRLLVDELVLQGPGGGGSLRATGEAAWTPGVSSPAASPRGLRATLTATLDRLRASVRPDREVTVSGTATATLGPQEAVLTGDLRVDRARIALPDQSVPQLGPDVTVRNLPPGVTLRPGAERTATGRPLRIEARVTLGDDVRVQGRGATARLRGAVDITGNSLTQPRLAGSIEVAEGEYLAFGQRLDIERGVLRFTGPADNPALDILAVRTNPAQRVGVQVTGRAQAPVVRLYAQPDLPESEKLSWLVLGRSSASGGAEAALLQEAALSLLTRNAGGGGPGIAGRLGLDELSVRREGAQGAAITLGKRFASNFYAAYERSLSGALGTLRVFYDLTERLTVRAEAGDRAGVDLIYTLSFD